MVRIITSKNTKKLNFINLNNIQKLFNIVKSNIFFITWKRCWYAAPAYSIKKSTVTNTLYTLLPRSNSLMDFIHICMKYFHIYLHI